MRKSVALALIQLGFLAACGGGGYGGGLTTPPPPTQTIATPAPPNVEAVTLDSGPAGLTFPSINAPFISVIVCIAGSPISTTSCQTIDHILVDTASSGFRVLASALAPLTLPAEKDSGNNPMSECLKFVDGSSYGSLAMADIHLMVSGETASNLNIQIIGDPTYVNNIPPDCTGRAENTVDAFGANGILGVGPFINDCNSGGDCPVPPPTGQNIIYYSCPGPSTCGDTTASLAKQVQNPVTLFGTDHNGVILELPTVASVGATSANGSLVFGIGTRSNNGLGSATVLPADPATGFITATYKSQTYIDAYMDSGSNANFFTDSSLAGCSGSNAGLFYCPTSTTSETASLKGTTSTTLPANFSVGDADTIPAGYAVFPGLGGPIGDTMGFDLGLPFFYGHNVFTALEGVNAGGTMGPYFAY